MFMSCTSPYHYRTCTLVIKRWAGHSKWQNIKHTKALKDAQRGKLFTKLGQQIKIAVQEGGSVNPAYNLKLEQLIEQAKRLNMPSTTVENIIKSTQLNKSQAKKHVLEIRGPGGCVILCEVFTSHITQTRQAIASLMKKHSCKYSDGGAHIFEHKGIIETTLPGDKNKSQETLLEDAVTHAIQCEAEDVKLIENKLQFTCDPATLKTVQGNLEKLNYKISSASSEFIPTLLVNLSDSDIDLCAGFQEKLENMDEVVKLSDNIA